LQASKARTERGALVIALSRIRPASTFAIPVKIK
jgi:hypothetical protein